MADEKTKKTSVYHNYLELIAVGSITGIAAGVVVTVFNMLVHEGESISKEGYPDRTEPFPVSFCRRKWRHLLPQSAR